MSLLNEALRKNRSENMQKIIFHAPSQRLSNPKRVLLIILFLAALAGFAYMWIMDREDTSVSSIIIPEAQDTGNIPATETVSTASEPEKKGAEQPFHELPAVKDETPDKPVLAGPDTGEGLKYPEKVIVQEKTAKDDKVHEVITSEPEETADAFLKKAVQLHRQARFDNALMMYKKVLNLSPANSEALFNMASIYITMNRYQDAYDILSKLAGKDKQDSKTILNMAVSEIGLKKYTDALSHLITLDGDDPELLFEISFHRGVAFSRMGKPDDAIVSYTAAEKINSNHSGLLLNMAVLYDRYGKYKEAVSYYTKLIESGSPGPEEMDTYKNRIETLRSYLPVSAVNGISKN
jgi:tetratricopeptide (TPR) repeat protein